MKKNIFIALLLLIATSISFYSCDEEELDSFESKSSINFTTLSGSYSFITNTGDDFIYEIAVDLIGDSLDIDRNFEVKVVRPDSLTTASDTQYELLEGTIKAGEFTGVLPIKLLKTAEIDNAVASLKLVLVESDDFTIGVTEQSEFVVSWTNQFIVPDWKYMAKYCCAYQSLSCYKAFVAATGFTEFNKYTCAYQLRESVGTKFGDYIKQWNLDNPDNHLKHDEGEMAGQDIEPNFYTHSKYN